jgi:diguanylate cyclase (GGDEF)-like protein
MSPFHGGGADDDRRMSAHSKTIFIVVLLAALATVLNALVVQRIEVGVALGLIATCLLGFGVGMAVRSRPGEGSPPESPTRPVPASTDRDLDNAALASRPDGPLMTDDVILFAQDLVAATSMERFRAAITSHLPQLLGTRRVWIASRASEGRQVVVPEQGGGAPHEDLLDADGHEWTTFALRVGNENVGVLGIESRGGVKPRARRLVQVLAPMIAQAMNTANAVESLRETSRVDLLTGLATRQEGMTRLETEIKRAQRGGTTMAVLMLDLDQFKSINDRFGHAVGDAMLAVVGGTIMRTLRASDIRVRWGGEEFLIVLPETDLPRAQVVANGLLREISAVAVPTASEPIATTVSIGITISRAGETDAAGMIRRADMGLYHAKAAGRACVRVVLGDRMGQPVSPGPSPAPDAPHHDSTLPFPDRRNPNRMDRRRVQGPGRRSTDPQPGPAGTNEERVRREDHHVQTGYR